MFDWAWKTSPNSETADLRRWLRLTSHSEVIPGQKSAWGKSHQIGTEKRPCGHRWADSRIVGDPEVGIQLRAIRGVTWLAPRPRLGGQF